MDALLPTTTDELIAEILALLSEFLRKDNDDFDKSFLRKFFFGVIYYTYGLPLVAFPLLGVPSFDVGVLTIEPFILGVIPVPAPKLNLAPV